MRLIRSWCSTYSGHAPELPATQRFDAVLLPLVTSRDVTSTSAQKFNDGLLCFLLEPPGRPINVRPRPDSHHLLTDPSGGPLPALGHSRRQTRTWR
jgi:hypothetical protein